MADGPSERRAYRLIEDNLSLDNSEILFYSVSISDSCSYKPLELMWDMTLAQFMDEREFVEVRNTLELARHKDREREMDNVKSKAR